MRKLENITVKPILDSLQYIQDHRCSVARFGDGEVDIITGHSIPYQEYDPDLARLLKDILQIPSNPELLVCLPDMFQDRERYNRNAAVFWDSHFEKYESFYLETCLSPWYGSTFLSRPYIDWIDKSQSAAYFAAIKELWQGRDVLLVEGETTRSGLGNDLFDGAASVSRIIGPSKNAFSYYDELMEEILCHGQDKLVILMLGPTAKVLAVDLSRRGYQAIDLGHIDSEYEWFQMGATHKVKLANKHTAEFNYDEGIAPVVDQVYESQILARVGVPVPAFPSSQQQPLVSVIVAFHNAEASLPRLLTSLDAQTYPHLEIILVNAASSDRSLAICQDYVGRENRARFYQESTSDVALARNKGLAVATGDYVTFVDARDFLDQHYVMALVEPVQEKERDIVVVNYTGFVEERGSFIFYHSESSVFQKEYTKSEWLAQEYQTDYHMDRLYHLLEMKLFRRALLEEIFFVEEGDNTLYKLYLKAQSIFFSNQGVYIRVEKEEPRDVLKEIQYLEERLALLVTLSYPVQDQVAHYKTLLSQASRELLLSGHIRDYRQVETKETLASTYQKE